MKSESKKMSASFGDMAKSAKGFMNILKGGVILGVAKEVMQMGDSLAKASGFGESYTASVSAAKAATNSLYVSLASFDFASFKKKWDSLTDSVKNYQWAALNAKLSDEGFKLTLSRLNDQLAAAKAKVAGLTPGTKEYIAAEDDVRRITNERTEAVKNATVAQQGLLEQMARTATGGKYSAEEMREAIEALSSDTQLREAYALKQNNPLSKTMALIRASFGDAANMKKWEETDEAIETAIAGLNSKQKRMLEILTESGSEAQNDFSTLAQQIDALPSVQYLAESQMGNMEKATAAAGEKVDTLAKKVAAFRKLVEEKGYQAAVDKYGDDVANESLRVFQSTVSAYDKREKVLEAGYKSLLASQAKRNANNGTPMVVGNTPLGAGSMLDYAKQRWGDTYLHSVKAAEGSTEKLSKQLSMANDELGKMAPGTAAYAAQLEKVAALQDKLSFASIADSEADSVNTLNLQRQKLIDTLQKLNVKSKEYTNTQKKIAEIDSKIESANVSLTQSTNALSSSLMQMGQVTNNPAIMALGIASMLAGAAESIGKAFKVNWIYGLAATVGTMASVLSAVSQMKQASHYASGGIVEGSKSLGDNIPIMATAGEMVLNQSQQGQLFNMLNGNRPVYNQQVTGTLRASGSELVAVIGNWRSTQL